MNKHDIEELQSFLQGEYIGEATSRSLKEVKQHQQTQNKIKNKNANKSLEQVLRHCFYKKGDSYHFEISSDDFEGNEQVLSFINKLDKFLNGKSDVELNEIHTKTKLFKMLTLVKGRWDPKEFSIYNMNDLLDGIHIKFFKMAKKSNIFNKTGYRFFHLSKNPNMKIINSTTETSHGGGAIYNQKTVFFYAVREDKLDNLFVKFIRQNKADNEKDKMFKVYGKYIYEYKPKRDDIFYTDNIDGLGERRTRDYLPESTPVFINTKNGLPVTRVDKNIVSRLLKSKKITPRKADFDVDGHIKQNPIYEYIDETIERFDAFMEEFNNEQIGDSEFIMESAQDNEYAKIVGDYIKKSGKHYFIYQKGVNKLCDDEHLSIEVESRIFDLARKIIDFNDKGNFNQYKAYYDAFCKLVHHPNNSCIMGPCINSINEGLINMQMRKETSKPIQLKPGTHLFHTSNNPNLRVMSPSHFKGESNANFITRKGKRKIGNDTYYASPRAYFYIEDFGSRVAKSGPSKINGYDSKGMPVIKDSNKLPGHLYMYVVKPGDRIYKDPELCGDAVFMSVKKPIKLIKIY